MATAGDVLGDVYVNVLADMSKLGPGLDKAKAVATSSIGMIAGKLAGLIGVGLSVGASFHAMMGAIEKGGALYDLSEQTGVAVKDLVILQNAFKNAGASAGMVPRTLMQMQRALASDKNNDLFEKMGLSKEKLSKLGAMEQFKTIGKGMASIQNPAERTAAAMKLFGRGGFMLKGLFADPNAVSDTIKKLGMMPIIMAKSAKGFDAFGDAINMAKEKMSGFWAGILVGMEPAISAATKFLDSFDFAKIGLKIGLWIDALRRAFADGKFGEIMYLSLQIGFSTALNFMIKGFQGAFIIIKRMVKDTFNTITQADFWIGIGQMALGGFLAIGAGLIEIFTTPIKYMDAAFTVLFSRITGEWAAGVGKGLIAALGPVAVLFDKVTGGKVSDEIAELISGVDKNSRSKEGVSFKDALADTNKKPTWLESQGKESAKLSGSMLNEGLTKLTKLQNANVSPMDLVKHFTQWMKNAPDMFPTDDLKNQFMTIMKPYLAAARADFDKKVPKGAEKVGKAPEEKDKGRGFVGFTDAIKRAQDKQFERAEGQRDKMIGQLGQLVEGQKGAQDAIFAGD